MKVKTLQDNVLRYGNKKGITLEVEKETGEHLIKKGFAEEVKEAPKVKEAKEEVKKESTKGKAKKSAPKVDNMKEKVKKEGE